MSQWYFIKKRCSKELFNRRIDSWARCKNSHFLKVWIRKPFKFYDCGNYMCLILLFNLRCSMSSCVSKISQTSHQFKMVVHVWVYWNYIIFEVVFSQPQRIFVELLWVLEIASSTPLTEGERILNLRVNAHSSSFKRWL